jgi:hypothetical protein
VAKEPASLACSGQTRMETQRRNTSGRAEEIHCFLVAGGSMINLFGRFSKEFAD